MVEKENIKPDFGRFLEEYQLFIWKLCNRYADGDLAVGLDHVQEITILLWLRFGKLRADAHPRQQEKWIGYIARDYFRSLSRRKKEPAEPFDETVHATDTSDADTPSSLLGEYLVCLAPSEREVVDLYVQGFKTKDIAQLLGISAAAVRQRLYRAVVHMRDYAGKKEPPTK